MSVSIFLARLIGPVMLIAGLGILFNQKHYRAMAQAFVKNAPLFYVISLLGEIAALAIVIFHNLWVADWRIIITLLGWANVLRGAFGLLMPEQASGYAIRATRSPNTIVISSLFASVIGATLIYFGYLA